MSRDREHVILEGIAAGDALGFPYEGTKPSKVGWGFVGRWGMTSDDTQLAHMTYLALQDSANDPRRFSKLLVERYSLWVLCFPPTVGFCNLRACAKMLFGLDPAQCGVRSNGNGALTRSILLGWELARDIRMEEFVDNATRVTHTGEEAIAASRVLARLVAYIKVNGYPASGCNDFLILLRSLDESLRWRRFALAIEHSHSLFELMCRTGQSTGIGGHAFQTLAVALWLFVNMPYRRGMFECVRAGGDTDSAAAVLGGLWAARYVNVPYLWHRILDYPIVNEPSPKRIFYNLLTALALIIYYVPKRMLGK